VERNAPFLVFDDADPEAALDGAMISKLRNGGEACTTGKPPPRARGRG
jgi:succinate-semialdehyde dehydrogenase/glutarate-semialdehyde dehydrogenase